MCVKSVAEIDNQTLKIYFVHSKNVKKSYKNIYNLRRKRFHINIYMPFFNSFSDKNMV